LCPSTNVLLAVRPDFTETFAAIYRAAFAGLEGDFGVFAALGASSRVHLARLAVGAIALCFPGLAAGGTTLGLVGIALGLEELLLGAAKGKR